MEPHPTTTESLGDAGPITAFLVADHERLDALLARAARDPEHVDMAAYAQFRAGLLKHIGIEEKILLPEAQRRRGGEPLAAAARLRLDHGALAALLVPTPTRAIVATIRMILAAHNPLEEGREGVYALCDALVGRDADAFVARLRAVPEVPVAANNDGPLVMPALERALARAGYALAGT